VRPSRRGLHRRRDDVPRYLGVIRMPQPTLPPPTRERLVLQSVRALPGPNPSRLARLAGSTVAPLSAIVLVRAWLHLLARCAPPDLFRPWFPGGRALPRDPTGGLPSSDARTPWEWHRTTGDLSSTVSLASQPLGSNPWDFHSAVPELISPSRQTPRSGPPEATPRTTTRSPQR